MLTPSMEDYLETIYELMKEKGYARVSDIATILAVQPSSVTKMIQKLDEKNFVTYEKYRGLVLTPEGEQLGRNMKQRHRMLEDFLRLLGVGESTIRKDVEGIEHHISPSTMRSLQSLVLFFQEYPEYQRAFEHFRRLQAGTAEDRSPENLKVMDE
ncbi:MAG: transcriptional regulator MntR [Kyrpidia tusciae]|nr:transcriptional regulator MntR [Kyrpidia tusciae]MBE3552851.1 transcriptional regulator MntR [Kyrpidia tusciae]